VIGVLAVQLNEETPPTQDQRNLLDAFVRQAALVLDRAGLREQAERARVAAESERLGRTLLDSISHEMRTPIAAILSAASQSREAKNPAALGALLDEVDIAGQRLNRLVGNLLDITRLETGHLKPKLDWGDLRDVVNVALKDLGDVQKTHHVTVKLPPNLPLIRMDFVLMEQAVFNLLHNATTHTPAGTEVSIHAAVDSEEVALSISDNGPGLPADFVDRAFDKFSRAPGTPAGGTGLGLSIVKGFVEAQGGTVRAENRADGGALFTISMPRQPQPEVPPETK
jgi:two-component system sensor histidine kinase KdpD